MTVTLQRVRGMPVETKHAVVTGGTGDLGSAVAAALRDSAWTVRAPGRDELDVTDVTSVRRYFHRKPVDLLVCAAGMTHDLLLARTSSEIWDKVWNVNFKGAENCALAAFPEMALRKTGHIVFLSSHSALHPPKGQVAYASAKAALLGLVAGLAAHGGPANVRVNVVLPGFLETRMTRSVTEARRSEILASHVLGRFNTCEQTADFIRFLHERLPHTSGQVFQLDSRTQLP